MNNRFGAIITVFILVISGIVFFGSEKSKATSRTMTYYIYLDSVKLLDNADWPESTNEIYWRAYH